MADAANAAYVDACNPGVNTVSEFPEMAQNPGEFSALLGHIQRLEPGVESILEFGVWQGGTLARFAHAFPWATVVGIDPNPMITHWNGREWGNLNIVYGASQSHDALQRALSLNQSRPFDVVHIDGDHTYDNAKADWEWARTHAKKLVAIHDVNSVGNSAIDCRTLWHEILETDYECVTIGGGGDGYYGIGVVWL